MSADAHMLQPISESLLAMVGIAAASSTWRTSLIQDIQLSACHKETLQLDTTVRQDVLNARYPPYCLSVPRDKYSMLVSRARLAAL